MVASFRTVKGIAHYELVVVFAWLVPFILLIPTLANLLSVQTEAHKAARYVAWERTAYSILDQKQDAELATEVQERFLRHPESRFGVSHVGDPKPWRDFGAAGHGSIVNFDESVAVAPPTRDDGTENEFESPTSGFVNASSRLNGEGGLYGQENAIRLDTKQNTRLSIPISSSISLLNPRRGFGEEGAAAPEDTVSGTYRFNVSASTSLVSDSWVPANDQMYHYRVSDLTSSTRNGLMAVVLPFAQTLSWFGFEEIDQRLYRGESALSAYEMVDDQQSVLLPPRLTE